MSKEEDFGNKKGNYRIYMEAKILNKMLANIIQITYLKIRHKNQVEFTLGV